MEWLSLDLLTSPAVVFSLATGFFLILIRSPWPWTRLGGGILCLLGTSFLGWALRDPRLRETILNPERIPVLLMVIASCGAAWLAFQPATNREDVPKRQIFDPTELLMGAFVIVCTTATAFLLGAPLNPMTNTSTMSDPLAAPWFMLGLRQLAAYFDPWVPLFLLPLLTIIGLWALPYLDPPPEAPKDGSTIRHDFEERRDVVYFFLFVWFLLALLPMVTALLHPVLGQPELNRTDLARPLSAMLWGIVRSHPPQSIWLRELPAILMLAFYFVVLPRQLPRWKRTRAVFGRYVKRLGAKRFHLAMAYMQLWMLIPLKMYGRWLLEVGYFIYLPELSFNF